VQLRLAQDDVQLPAIGFRMAARSRSIDTTRPFDVAFHLHADTWNGRERLQAKLLDFALA
jgi:hypothetical protein